MNIVIRRSRSDESEQLIEIWRRSVDATHHFLSAQDRREIERQVCAFFFLWRRYGLRSRMRTGPAH